jgi:hypothetical protein
MPPEEVHVQSQGGGNGFNLKLSENKVLGITGPVVIPALCLILVAVVGWLRSADLKTGLAAISDRLVVLETKEDKHRGELQALALGQFDQLREQLRAQTVLMNMQQQEFLDRLRDNRDATGAKLDDQNQLLWQQSEEMRKHHAIQIWNQSHPPEQHLSIDLPLPTERHR